MQAAANTPAPAPMTDIHGIKPLEIPASMEMLPIYVLAAAAIIAVIWAAIHFWRKYRNRKQAPPAIVIPPHEAALRLLETLSDIENMDGKAFYFSLSAILRTYIGDRYGINALEMTTEELLPRLDPLDITKDRLTELKTLIRSADPVKFAGVPAAVGKMRQDLDSVKNFISQTAEMPAQAGNG